MPHLFSPLQIKGIEFKNRIVVSPMCEYSSEDGFANHWHLVHLGSRAVGGAALVMTEATAISPEGRISPQDLGIWKDEHVEALKEITDFIRTQGARAGIQLAHAGRKASHDAPWKGNKFLQAGAGGWQTVAPSAIPFGADPVDPLALDKEGLQKIFADFRSAAKRAVLAGFEVIEIHGAHGYLCNEFLSAVSNKRTDEYGGSFENRIRFLLEIIESIKTVWPKEYPLFLRISATDWSEGGWTLDDSIALAKIVHEKGVDLVDCSSGGNVSGVKIPVGLGYQVPFSAAIRKQTGVLTGAVGMIVSSAQAEAIISSGEADLVFLAREMLRDPYFPLRAARELSFPIEWPKQYERAKL